MSIQIISVFLILLSIAEICFFFFSKSAFKNYHRNLGTALFLNAACNLSYTLFLHKTFHGIAHLIFGLYEALLICSLFCIVWFCVKYFNINKKLYYLFDILSIIICVDVVMLLVHSLFQQSTVYRHLKTETGMVIITLGEKWALKYHEILCLVTALVALLIIALVTVNSNGYIRKRNTILFVLLSLLLVVEWIAIKVQYQFDMASALIGICFILIYFFTIIYEPKALLKETIRQVSTAMSEYLFVFDKENHCIFTSDSAKNSVLTNVEKEYMENTLKNWLATQKNLQVNNVIQDFPFTIGGKLGYYRISIHIFEDFGESQFKKASFHGCFVIITDQTEEKLLRDSLHFSSTHDRLTGLYNFDYFAEKANKFLECYPAEQHIMIEYDVKEFKLINDQFGDNVADNVLIHISNVLKENYGSRAIYCRQGKDQFFVLFNERDFERTNLNTVINKLQNFTFPNKYYHMHIYAGVYCFTSQCGSIRHICDCCYHAVCRMNGGYESILFFDDRMRQDAIKEQFISGRIREAIKNNEIEIHLQAQVDKNGKVMGAEALARWNNPQRGYIVPNDFIPILEHNGLIYRLDLHIWELSCRTIKKWNDAGENGLYISVNVSPKDIHYLNVLEELERLVKKYGISKEQLKVEITESAIAEAPEKLLNLITDLTASGFTVEMDDFGSGSSTLGMLKDMPIKNVKLDMTLMNKLNDSPKGKAIVESILKLFKKLEISMIAEGVETEEQAEFLVNGGCEIMQGYLFSKPVPVAEFEQKFTRLS